jgi:hypothetical protein
MAAGFKRKEEAADLIIVMINHNVHNDLRPLFIWRPIAYQSLDKPAQNLLNF